MALFKVKVQWVNSIQHIILNNGVTLIIPNSELTLRGVQDQAIIEVFGHELYNAITKSPIRQNKLTHSIHTTECMLIILTKNGTIISLALNINGGFTIQNKLYT